MTTINPAEHIIWSADVDGIDTLLGLLDQMPNLTTVKVDRLLLTKIGLEVIQTLNERGLRVFADAKIVEIPSKSLELAELHLGYRPWMLNCMAGIQSSGIMRDEDSAMIDGLKRFAEACHQVGTKSCGVTVLTSKTPSIVQNEFGGHTPTEQVLYYVAALQEAGFTDVVCSPQEIKAIRAEKQFDSLELNTPGIRPGWSSASDQARIDTPEAALTAGATRLVIGRPITEGNPGENFKRIIDGITASTQL
jgi:orotidine-5'-phosphate decarboxylase